MTVTDAIALAQGVSSGLDDHRRDASHRRSPTIRALNRAEML
jgi:hypothetical protein